MGNYEGDDCWFCYNICQESPIGDYASMYHIVSDGNNNLNVINEYQSTTTTFKYNARGQLIEKIVCSKGDAYSYAYQETTKYSYNYLGLMTYVTFQSEGLYPRGYNSASELWYEYNSKGDVTKILYHNPQYDWWDKSTYDYTYDQNGRASQMIAYNAPYGEGAYPTRTIHNYVYTSDSRLTEERITVFYDGDEYNPSSTGCYDIICSYDDHGNVVRKTIYGDGFVHFLEYVYSYCQV